MVDFGNCSTKEKWVCPDDRQLALRAILHQGWSVKTQHAQHYGYRTTTLDDTEQKTIRSVIERAEALDAMEQERVGRLVERLNNMKKNVMGTGENQCILCGDKFGMLSSPSLFCHDCKKAVCQKCGIETSCPARKEPVWRCKICAETREMWKKSGAWFFKGLPKYVIPTKNNLTTDKKYPLMRKLGLERKKCPRSPLAKRLDVEEGSSSDEERRPRRIVPKARTTSDALSNHSVSHLRQTALPLYERKSPGARSIDSFMFVSDFLSATSDIDKTGKVCQKGDIKICELNDSSESENWKLVANQQTIASETDGSRATIHNSTHTDGNQIAGLEVDVPLPQADFSYCRQDSQLSLITSKDGHSESDLSGSSISGYRTTLGTSEEIPEEALDGTVDGVKYGTIELTLFYDSVANSIHVSLLRAKGLKAMDINGLADPFCKLNLVPVGIKSHRLRTRTVHKTRNPEFNETLTFYGVTDSDMSHRALHIIILDDDKYGNDFMGEARFPLAKLHMNVEKHLHLNLDKPFRVEAEDLVWGEKDWSHGQILITLCYSTRRKALLVGIIKCTNLIPMDNNGLSDPFVKLFLKPDQFSRKYKTTIKWKNLNPVYNEEFVFETKMTDLSQQTLILTVWDKDYGKSNDYLGCLQLGCISKGERLRHWIDMIKFPDHKHEGWHNLCEEPLPDQKINK